MDNIAQIRHFNRFYTQRLGLLNRNLPGSHYSLTEARILFELGHTEELVAQELSRFLQLDPAYLSRLLKRFEKLGLIEKRISPADSRKQLIRLTLNGQQELDRLQQLSAEQLSQMLLDLDDDQRSNLTQSMKHIEDMLTSPASQSSQPIIIRSHRPGDAGYLTYRHARLYSELCGFDTTFEGYVAEGVALFLKQFDAAKDSLWIAEQAGKFLGSIAIVQTPDKWEAQLRWFLVEPEAQGQGLGKQLLEEALAFCRRQGYQSVVLWTVSTLDSARHLYQQAGFQLTKTESHTIWGKELTEEMWRLALIPSLASSDRSK